MKKLLTALAAVLALGVIAAPSALAVHEANNQFDLAATSAAPGADGSGSSIFTSGNNGWNNRVEVTGLLANTNYTWYGIGGVNTQAICSFTTDADGSGSCSDDRNSFLGRTEVRETASQTVVLFAVGSTDDDNKVEDGEIERRGTCRDEGNAACQGRP